MTRGSRLAVWGDPIAHSKSPALHAAAYAVLGLDWEYGRRQVTETGFEQAVRSLDESWRGLSLTMPLKDEAFRIAESHDRHAELTGVVNTLRLGGTIDGYNTDVGGIVDSLAENGITALERVRLLGAGATASSAVVAIADLGATRIDLRARRPERAAAVVALGERLGMDVQVEEFSAAAEQVDLTIASLPGGSALDPDIVDPLASGGGPLFDVAYSPWPSALASAWSSGPAISGLGMLLHQAIRQIRIFLHGDPASPLPDEDAVLAAMRAALAS